VRAPGHPDYLESRGGARDSLHGDPNPPALSGTRPQRAARRVQLHGWRLQRQVDSGGRRRRRLLGYGSSSLGHGHALRSVTDIDIVQKAWSSGRDPMFLPGNFNNRILIDACQPYNRKLRGEFPKVVEVPENVREQLRRRFSQIFKTRP
jgi:hypothetical protein